MIGPILVVEDNPADVQLLREALRFNHVADALTVLQDSEEALAVIRDAASGAGVQLVVLDLNLPKVSGLELLKSIRARKQWDQVPVVVMSSSIAESDVTQALRLGATRYLQKPIDIEQLIRVGEELKALLQGRERPAPVIADHEYATAEFGGTIATTASGGRESGRLVESEEREQSVAVFDVYCDECRSFRDAYLQAVNEVITRSERQMKAVVEGESDPHRFDLLIHDANERKQNVKYAYVHHRETNCNSPQRDETH